MKMDIHHNMQKMKRLRRISFFVFALILTLLVGYLGIKIIKYERKQTNEINRLSGEVLDLRKLVEKLQHGKEVWLDDGFNYLAIGNSITSHSQTEYWWNDNVGMAASTEERDYVHQIKAYLSKNGAEQVKAIAYNFFNWETQYWDRAETLELLNIYLSSEVDLVTVQLGENASDISNFEDDCIELYDYVKKMAPNAQIIVIDDFWDNGEKAALKKSAADICGVDYVSLEDIKGKTEYQAGTGTTVYDKSGVAHIIEHDGVARHPNDSGMAWIANAVIKIIK